MPRVTFAVDVVTGKARPRILRNGHGYTPARTVQAQHAVAEAYRRACTSAYGTVLCAGPHVPVFLAVKTSRPLPKGRPKSMLAEPDTYKPDWDNIGKLVSDALNGVAYADDAQVVRAMVAKLPRTRDGGEQTLVTVSWDEEGNALAEKEAQPCSNNPSTSPTRENSSPSRRPSTRWSPQRSARRTLIAFAVASTIRSFSSTTVRAVSHTT